jgi:hypothetical protein
VLFNFKLTPLGEIVPWGRPEGAPSLHWFGLTDGQYWIDVGGQRLFEYHPSVLQPGEPTYCAYQVARLFEDVNEMSPAVLEPVPSDLTGRISGRAGRESRLRVEAWWQRSAGRDDDDTWSALDGMQTWIARRHLDSLYLSPGIDVVMWSDAESVHIEWDNSQMKVQGLPAWTATAGSYTLPRAKFVEEVCSFNDRLMEQMAERVERVLKGGALDDVIHVDLEGLRSEQVQRARALEVAMQPAPATDWDAVRRSFALLDAGAA